MEKKLTVCGKPCLVYARVVGFMTPVQQWNRGKQAEYMNRQTFGAPGEGGKAPKPLRERCGDATLVGWGY